MAWIAHWLYYYTESIDSEGEQCSLICTMKTRLFKYTENFITQNWKFSAKKFWYFHISAQNVDCGYSLEPPRRGSSDEYPQSMFLSRNKKNNVYQCNPQFYCTKVGFKGVKLYRHVFVMWAFAVRTITKTRLFKYIENFTTQKTESFPIKILVFFIFLLKTYTERKKKRRVEIFPSCFNHFLRCLL